MNLNPEIVANLARMLLPPQNAIAGNPQRMNAPQRRINPTSSQRNSSNMESFYQASFDLLPRGRDASRGNNQELLRQEFFKVSPSSSRGNSKGELVYG